MGYYVPKTKPHCFNCPFRTGDYCGILTEHDAVKDYLKSYEDNPYCPLVEVKEWGNDQNP